MDLMRNKQALMVGFILIVTIAFGAFLLSGISSWRGNVFDLSASLTSERHRLEQSVARLSNEKNAFQTDDVSRLLWEARQTAEATAKIQSGINNIAGNAGIKMRSIAPIQNNHQDSFASISFRLEFEANLVLLVPFLKELEYSQPAVVVTSAHIRRLARPTTTSTHPDIFVQLEVTAPIIVKPVPQ